MTVAVTALTVIGSGTDADHYDSPSVTPTASRLILAFANAEQTTVVPTTPTLEDGSGGPAWGLTWSMLKELLYLGGATQRKMWLFGAIQGASPATGICRVNFGTGVTHIGCEASIVQAAVTTLGTDPAKQLQKIVVAQGSAVTAAAAALAAVASNAGNRAIAFISHNANELTKPRGPAGDGLGSTDWTEIHDGNHTLPSTGTESQWRSDAYEGSLSASWTTGSTYGLIGAEISDVPVVGFEGWGIPMGIA